MNKRIFLWGMPGSGKSSLGKKLAAAMQLPFFDLDACIEKEAGKSVAEIFETSGEAAFREMEKKSLQQLIEAPAFVMACGGGTPLFFAQDELMLSKGTVVYLYAPAGMLHRRLLAQQEKRPLLAHALAGGQGEAAIKEMLEKRAPVYARASIRFVSHEHKNRTQDLITLLQKLDA